MTERRPFGPPFEAPAVDDWLALVERDLRGASFDDRLVRRDLDGVETRPLYTADDLADLPEPGWPGQAPWTRGRAARGGWRVVQRVDHPDPNVARRQAAEELSQGADGVLLAVDASGVGYHGTRLARISDLRALLDTLPLAGRTLALAPGANFLATSTALARLELPAGVALHLGADPVAELARTGLLPGGTRALGWLGDLAVWTARTLPDARAACVDTGPFHLAGATEVDDLAIALATGLTYLRAMEDAGLSVPQALGQVVFRVSLGTELLGATCKLRALRALWGRVAAACGAGAAPTAGALIHALPAQRALTARDPWTNLLRNTAACFAGACGGADLVTTAPFDAVHGLPGDHGRRLARNTQLVLAHESHLGRVADPAGGAFFFEERTQALARAAWARFKELEAAGGILPALERGLVQGWIERARAERAARIARRVQPITGVSEFALLAEPHLDERAAPHPPPPPDAPDLVPPHLPDPGAGVLCLALERLLAEPDAPPLRVLTELAEVLGAPIAAHALPAARLAEPWERLRDRSDALAALSGERPRAFLATIGELAEHTARTGFTTNLLAAGGLLAVEGPGGDDVEATARAFQRSGAHVAIICGPDPRYEALAVDACAALRAAGARQVWLAGKPRGLDGALRDAGLTGALYLGCDVLSVLEQLWRDAFAGPTPGQEDA